MWLDSYVRTQARLIQKHLITFTLVFLAHIILCTILCLLVPAQVSAPNPTTLSSTSVMLEWDEITEGSEDICYLVSWDSDTGSGSDETEDNFISLNNLESNTEYTFSVTAINSAGSGDPSPVSHAVTCKFNAFGAKCSVIIIVKKTTTQQRQNK